MSSEGKYTENDELDLELNEPQPDYEKAELDLLREALKRTDLERFLFTTRLYKIQQTMQNAVITFKPDTLGK